MKEMHSDFEKIFPQEKTVVFLHAHPDDESFLTAGILQELIVRGRRCVVVYAAASLVPYVPRTHARQVEAASALKLLGSVEVVYLPFCEPKYSGDGARPFIQQNASLAARVLRDALKDIGIITPFILVSYDRNGGYGNPDHGLLHSVGGEFASVFSKDMYSFFEVTLCREAVLKWIEHARGRLGQVLLPKLSYWSKEFGLSRSEITHCFRLSFEQIALKRRALSAHDTQMRSDEFPLALGDEDFDAVFGTEYFVQL